jgi:flavodoxin
MKYAVRYYSRSGNTKDLADSFAKELGVEAVSVDSNAAAINEGVDILFVGGALYAYGIDEKLQSYLDNLSGDKIKKAVVFSTSWISKHAIELIKASLKNKGIDVEDESFYSRENPRLKRLHRGWRQFWRRA